MDTRLFDFELDAFEGPSPLDFLENLDMKAKTRSSIETCDRQLEIPLSRQPFRYRDSNESRHYREAVSP